MIKKLLFFLFTIFMSVNMMATEVKDTLVASNFAATSTTYKDFSNVLKNSGAIYAGNSAKTSSGGIQLRSKNSNSGIVSTTSSGKIKSVKIIVESGSNTLDIYGSNTAYSSASDLYGSGKGTKIGSLSSSDSVVITGNYQYIGLRSYNGALYLTKIIITWEDSDEPPTPIDPPVVLGEKTIAEFIELKNEKDTCILTGLVDSIVNSSAFYINDGTDLLRVYKPQTEETIGLLDTITIKTTYAEYKEEPQATQPIVVELKKYIEPVDPGISTDISNIEDKANGYKIFNGTQILIIKNEKTFNILGQRLD